MTVRALVVGSLVMDLAFRVPRRPEPGEVVLAEDFGTFRGGKGYNQAVALARLGAEVTMIGAVGADDHGDGFIDALAREGVDCSRVVQLRGVYTGVAVPLIGPDGDVAFVQHPGANHQLAPAHCADLPDCDVLLLQGEVTPSASEHAARVLQGRGTRVLLNPAPVDDVTAAMVDDADLLCPNEHEAKALLRRRGVALPAPATGEALAAALRTERCEVVVTMGAAGAAWAGPEGTTSCGPPAVEAVDATGAGDSFCAALAVALGEGADRGEALRFACAAGAHAVTIAGAEPSLPSRADVEALLAR